MNKKGVFMTVFAVLTFAILVFAIYIFGMDDNNLNKAKQIGGLQNEMLKTFNNAENEKLLLENNFIMDESIAEFKNVEWFYDDEGRFSTIDLENKFLIIFLENLNKVTSYNYNLDDIMVESNIVIIDKTLDYDKEFKDIKYNYKLNAKYNQKIKFELDKFILLKEEIINNLNCFKKDDISNCVDNKGLELSMIKEDNIIKFEIKNGEEIYILENNKLKKEQGVFTFSLDLSKVESF